MFAMLKTLRNGVFAQNEARLRDHFALELIDQKIRETDTALKAAKATLASQIQRLRSETRQLEVLTARIANLNDRTQQAVYAGQDALARDAAVAIADLENEHTTRDATVTRLGQQIKRLRLSVEKSQRRLVDLRQGAMMARAVRTEQSANVAIARSLPSSPAREAQELIDEVLAKDCPSELDDIYEEVVDGITHATVEEIMGRAGFGDKTLVSADDVLERFKKPSPQPE